MTGSSREAEQERLTGLLEQEWSAIGTLLAGLTAGQWRTAVLPGWTVHDVLAHMIGTERTLAGAAHPPVPAGAELGPHVRNDIGKINEAWIAALRDRPDDELLADFRAVTAERLAALRQMPAEDFHAPSWTPAGQATYARFMQIRVFDCWMHEQDIRAALGLPGHDSGPVAEQALAEVVMALGYIVGKRGRAPDGSSVLISLRGPVERELAVVVDGRAAVVPALDGPPTASLALSSSLFLRLAGGREDAEAALAGIELGGDQALARQLALNLAYTI
ncbi:MAG TPA: maleylpyruvate isomerase family mycothiol-dependent enzyme [Streptosporangiaceae bacterium]